LNPLCAYGDSNNICKKNGVPVRFQMEEDDAWAVEVEHECFCDVADAAVGAGVSAAMRLVSSRMCGALDGVSRVVEVRRPVLVAVTSDAGREMARVFGRRADSRCGDALVRLVMRRPCLRELRAPRLLDVECDAVVRALEAAAGRVGLAVLDLSEGGGEELLGGVRTSARAGAALAAMASLEELDVSTTRCPFRSNGVDRRVASALAGSFRPSLRLLDVRGLGLQRTELAVVAALESGALRGLRSLRASFRHLGAADIARVGAALAGGSLASLAALDLQLSAADAASADAAADAAAASAVSSSVGLLAGLTSLAFRAPRRVVLPLLAPLRSEGLRSLSLGRERVGGLDESEMGALARVLRLAPGLSVLELDVALRAAEPARAAAGRELVAPGLPAALAACGGTLRGLALRLACSGLGAGWHDLAYVAPLAALEGLAVRYAGSGVDVWLPVAVPAAWRRRPPAALARLELDGVRLVVEPPRAQAVFLPPAAPGPLPLLPLFARLERLALRAVGGLDEGALGAALREATRLRELRVDRCFGELSGVAELRDAAALLDALPPSAATGLRELALDTDGLDAAGAAALAPALARLRGLTSLSLRGNHLVGAAGAGALAPAIAALSGLRELLLDRVRVGAQGAAALLPALTGLRELRVLRV
jgi:hypothetical protein